jgi:phage-related protein
MGFWGSLWNGIKSIGSRIYDGARSVGNFVSNVYDKVKTYLPAPIRAVGDQVQNTYNQVRNVGDVIRSNPLGLKDGGRVDMPILNKSIGIFPVPIRRDEAMKKFYQA